MESAPLDVYQLPVGYHSILLTDYLVYGINEDNNCLAVISPKSVSVSTFLLCYCQVFCFSFLLLVSFVQICSLFFILYSIHNILLQ